MQVRKDVPDKIGEILKTVVGLLSPSVCTGFLLWEGFWLSQLRSYRA
jgi:hypothetical protein